MRRTADSIEESKSQSSASNGEITEGRKRSNANLRPWKPGQSGNPSGRRKHDKAKDIAQAIFEENEEEIYRALGKSLLKGNAYVFKELAERAYGKLTDKMQIGGDSELIDRLTSGRKRLAKPQPVEEK